MRPIRAILSFGVCALLVAAPLPPRPALALPTPGDDEVLAYWSAGEGDADLRLHDLAGGRDLGRLTTDDTPEIDPAISPNGVRVAFARMPSDRDTHEIVVMDTEGGAEVRLTTNRLEDRQPAWSPDGARLAFVRGQPTEGHAEIFVMSADGGGLASLTTEKQGRADAAPAWSAFNQIAFVSDRDPQIHGLPKLWVMNPDGSGQVRMTGNPADCAEGNPDWSPDGTKLAFDVQCAAGGSRIVVRVAGVDTVLPDVPGVEEFDPSWSPAGDAIAFAGHGPDGNRDIFVMGADGSTPVRVTSGAPSDLGPDWHRVPGCTTFGTMGPDELTAAGPAETLCGLGGADILTAHSTGSTLRGGGAPDTLRSDVGDDVLVGGDGEDTGDFSSAAAAVTVTLATSGPQVTGGAGSDSVSGLENLRGGMGGDLLSGDGGANKLAGGPGDDHLAGGGGEDSAWYRHAGGGATVTANAGTGPGQDGDAGTDTFSGIPHLIGSPHSDALTGDGGDNLLDGGLGDDTLDGGPGGTDTADYLAAPGGVTLTLASADPQPTGSMGADRVLRIDNVRGSEHADRLAGGPGPNGLFGMGGDDTLQGGEGDDSLKGGDGNDVHEGGPGIDALLGEDGNDVLDGGDGNDDLRSNLGDDRLLGGNGGDRLTGGEGADALDGGPDADTVLGEAGADSLDGGPGDDVIRGGAGGDRLSGGEGADRLFGEAARDVLIGGPGGDRLTGGSGRDTFRARDGEPDRLSGGAGQDRASLDRGLDTRSKVEVPRKKGKTSRRSKRRAVAPGVRLTRIRMPGQRIFVLTVNPLARPVLDVALAQDRLPGVERTGSMAKRHGAVAAVNGDFGFGPPLHVFAKDGDLKRTSDAFGYNFAVSKDETQTFIGHPEVRLVSIETGTGESWPVHRWNDDPPAFGQIAAYTAVGGVAQPPPTNTCWARLSPVSPLRWAEGQMGVRADHAVQQTGCTTARPATNGGIVLAARALSHEARLLRSLVPGEVVTAGWSLGWRAVLDTVGGFPQLLRDGQIVIGSCSESICRRNARTAVGVTANGRVLIVVVDRGKGAHGLTLVALARELERLGAVSAVNLDGGGSSTMWVKGKVVNRPSGGKQRKVSSALLVLRGPDVDEPTPFGATALLGSGSAAPSKIDSDVLLALRDPGSTGGLLDALADGPLAPDGFRLTPELRSALAVFRAAR